ncbi:MAG: transposase [Parcubacteria group bacterium Gr01-1014_48]|nr:MAG: transposase [Parcubacteria group bacterium Gr01-1014_48]
MIEVLSGPYTLKQILNDHWDAFVEDCERSGKPLRSAILENVQKVRNCRDPLKRGYHPYQCPNGCGDERMIPHSCKSRFCSSCGKVATDNWMERMSADLLNVPYHHIVFTIPQELRNLFGWKRALLGVLFTAAKTTVLSICAEKYGYIPGIVMVQHTFGSDLKFNPHIHLLITGGGLSLDRKRWVHNVFIPWDMLKARWKYQVVSRLKPRLQTAIAEGTVGRSYTMLGTHSSFFRILEYIVWKDMVCVDGKEARQRAIYHAVYWSVCKTSCGG